MTGPREWRHAGDCAAGWAHTRTCWYPEGRCQDGSHPCSCGLSAVRDAIAVGHLPVVAPDGTLMRAFPVNAYHPDRDDPDDYDRNVYRLVPIEEEP